MSKSKCCTLRKMTVMDCCSAQTCLAAIISGSMKSHTMELGFSSLSFLSFLCILNDTVGVVTYKSGREGCPWSSAVLHNALCYHLPYPPILYLLRLPLSAFLLTPPLSMSKSTISTTSIPTLYCSSANESQIPQLRSEIADND